jgi:hypothetical protein
MRRLYAIHGLDQQTVTPKVTPDHYAILAGQSLKDPNAPGSTRDLIKAVERFGESLSIELR